MPKTIKTTKRSGYTLQRSGTAERVIGWIVASIAALAVLWALIGWFTVIPMLTAIVIGWTLLKQKLGIR